MRKIVAAAAALLLGSTLATPATPAPGPWASTMPAQTSWSRVATFPGGTAYVVLSPVSGVVILLKSTDWGVTWSRQEVPAGGNVLEDFVYDLTMATATRGFARSATGGTRYDVYRTDDGGATWPTVGRTPPLPPGYLSYPHWRMDAAPGGRTVAYYDSPYRRTPKCPVAGEWPKAAMTVSRDAGATWTRTPLPIYAGWLFDMDWWDGRVGAIAVREAVVSPGACWQEDNAKGWRQAIWTTRDAGRTWRRSAFTCGKECATVTWVSPRRIVATGYHGEVYASDDAGRTARRIGTIGSLLPERDGYPVHPWDVDFAGDEMTGYAVTHHSQTYRTSDGGRTWTLDDVHETTPEDYWYRSVSTFDGQRTIAVTPFGVRTRLGPQPQR